jgi:hypothetical protein
MSTAIDKGNQNVYFQYGDPLTGAEFDGKDLNVSALGIYSGAILSTIDNADVAVSPWTCIIGDGTNTVTGRTTSSYTVPSVSSTANTIVLRWFYANQTNWYVDMLAVAPASVQTNDLIVGVVNYSVGGVITGYNYSTRSNPIAFNKFMTVTPTSPASMKVVINGGWCTYGVSTLYVPTQLLSSSITAPVANPRIDVIYINTGGSVLVSTGTEAVSPVPNYPIGNVVLAYLNLSVAISTITSAVIQDARSLLTATNNAYFMDLTSNQTVVSGTKLFQGGFGIPPVTSDPVSPVNGQMWLRIDF